MLAKFPSRAVEHQKAFTFLGQLRKAPAAAELSSSVTKGKNRTISSAVLLAMKGKHAIEMSYNLCSLLATNYGGVK